MRILSFLRRAFKLLLCIVSILIYLVAASVIQLLTICSMRLRLRILSRLTKNLNQILRFILGVRIIVENKDSLSNRNGLFIISNHTTYIDGIVLGSLFPVIYVSKKQVKSWPLFGQMVSMAGTIFIDRERKHKIPEFVQDIAGVLNQEINILLFPEGTSTNGSRLLPFQSAFFASPLVSKSKILPVGVVYTHIDNQPVPMSDNNKVHWYGQIKFFKHLWQFMGLKSVVANVKIAPVVEPDNFTDDSSGRKQLSKHCHEVISKELNYGSA